MPDKKIQREPAALFGKLYGDSTRGNVTPCAFTSISLALSLHRVHDLDEPDKGKIKQWSLTLFYIKGRSERVEAHGQPSEQAQEASVSVRLSEFP